MRLLPLDPRPGRVIRCLRFAADGLSLAAVSGRPDDPRRRPVVFDLRTGAATALPTPARFDKRSRLEGDPAFGPDPRVRAEVRTTPSRVSVVRLVDARGDRPVGWELPAGEDDLAGYFTAPQLSADGDTLFVGYYPTDPGDYELPPDQPGVWYGEGSFGLMYARLDVAGWQATGDPERTDEELPTDGPTRATCFEDAGAGVLAVGTMAGTAVLCDLIGGTPPLTVEHIPGTDDPPPVDAVLLGPDGRHLVTRAAGTLAVWDALTGRELARPAAPRPVTDAAFTPDGRSLLASCMDGGVYRFAVPGYARAERLDFGHGPVYSLAVAPDGLTAAAGTAAGTAVLWDL